MAHISEDRVRELATTTGTGAFTLPGTAPTGYRTFASVLSVGDTVWYCISHQALNEWEVGLGTYSASNTLTRTTVVESSNAGATVNFSAGTKDVFITLAAGKTIQQDASGNVGVGTSSPSFRFDVVHADNNVAHFYQSDNTKNTDVYINNAGSVNNFLISRRSNGESWLYNSGNEAMAFYTNGVVRMAIGGSGDIQAYGGNITLNGSTVPTFNFNNTSAGAGYKSQTIYYDNSVAKWATGVDINDLGQNNYFFYDAAAGSTRGYIESNGDLCWSYPIYSGSGGGDFGRSWQGLFRKDQNATTYVGFINGTPGANAAVNIAKIGGTANSFVDWALADNTGAPYDAFEYGSAVGSVRWSFGGTERMRVDSAGNVGIGTTTMTGKLNVSGKLYAGNSTDVTPDTSWSGQLTILGNGYSGGIALDATGLWVGTNSSARSLVFATDETERARITGAGNLGVGTTTPRAKVQSGGDYTQPVNSLYGSNIYYDYTAPGWKHVANGYGTAFKMAESSTGVGQLIFFTNNVSGNDAAATQAAVLTFPRETGTLMTTTTPQVVIAKSSANQAISAATMTKVQFATESADTAGTFASNTLTPTRAGYYHINSTLYLSGSAVQMQAAIYFNGASLISGPYTSSVGASVSGLVYCNGVSDYIDIYVYAASGVTLASGACWFFAHFVRS